HRSADCRLTNPIRPYTVPKDSFSAKHVSQRKEGRIPLTNILKFSVGRPSFQGESSVKRLIVFTATLGLESMNALDPTWRGDLAEKRIMSDLEDFDHVFDVVTKITEVVLSLRILGTGRPGSARGESGREWCLRTGTVMWYKGTSPRDAGGTCRTSSPLWWTHSGDGPSSCSRSTSCSLGSGSLSSGGSSCIPMAISVLRTIPNDVYKWTPCVRDVSGFASCFLFSVETQHTIGYGSRHTTEECPEAIFVMCLQSIVGVMIQAFMVGIVFAKLSRPKKRTQTLLFSRNAVICQRDGHLCLMFRVGDMRKSHIVEAHVRAQLIRRKVTQEGEVLPYYQHELTVGGDGEEDKIFFIWPTTIVHKIDPSSPLYVLSASEMIRERFEIVVILEVLFCQQPVIFIAVNVIVCCSGVIESTGMTTQARSSYLPSEVLWGHRFEPLVAFKKETGEYEVDYSLFNNTYEVDTPLCSAKALDELRGMQQQQQAAQQANHHSEEQQRLERLMSPTRFPALRAPPDTLDLGSVDSNSVSIEDQPSTITVTSPIDLPGPEVIRKPNLARSR
ncbi:hypothetical protein L9F63_023611, partial [Diploptera punctata]